LIDVHCHILPGLDDGPATLEESLAMARLAAADGVEVIVATPHVERDHLYPPPDLVRELTARLNQALQAEGLALRVWPGAEIPDKPELLEGLEAGQLMTVGDLGRHVLVELSAHAPAAHTAELFFRLQLAGITPIVAHVERAVIFRRQPELLREFRDRGYPLQLNAESLRATWGMRRYARRLVNEGLVDLLASDGHGTRQRKPLLSPARRVLPAQVFDDLTLHNPLRLLQMNDTGTGREENAVTASPNEQDQPGR